MRTAKPKDYKQMDSRWAKLMYSSRGDKSQTMKAAGCAPTAAADILATFCDPSITPVDVAKQFVAKKFRIDGKGTKPGCFKWLAGKFKGKGIAKFKRLYTLNQVIAALEQNALIVAHMGPGKWTKGGHFIVLWRYLSGMLYACDPGSTSSNRTKQEAKALKKEAKGFYAFWPQKT